MKIQFLDSPYFVGLKPRPPLVYYLKPLIYPNVRVIDDVTGAIDAARTQSGVPAHHLELVLTPEEYAMLTTSPAITERVEKRLIIEEWSTDLWKNSNQVFRRAFDAVRHPFARDLQVQAWLFILQQFFDVAIVRVGPEDRLADG